VLSYAVSSVASTTLLYHPKNNPIGGANLEPRDDTIEQVNVNTVTLDGFLSTQRDQPTISFIKCDVEGHELDVFKGAEKMLRKDKPILLFEYIAINYTPEQKTALFDYLHTLGYQGYFWNGSHIRPINEFDLTKHQDYHSDTNPCYTTNFFYGHQENAFVNLPNLPHFAKRV
jgi:hypothetical protein